MGAYGAIAAARKSRAFPPKKLRESKGIQSPWRRFGGGAPKVLALRAEILNRRLENAQASSGLAGN